MSDIVVLPLNKLYMKIPIKGIKKTLTTINDSNKLRIILFAIVK